MEAEDKELEAKILQFPEQMVDMYTTLTPLDMAFAILLKLVEVKGVAAEDHAINAVKVTHRLIEEMAKLGL